MLINLFSISVRFLCFCRNFVEASGVILQVVEFPHSIVCDECTERAFVDINKILKWQAKFWYQTRSNPLKADESIGNIVHPKHNVDNFDP